MNKNIIFYCPMTGLGKYGGFRGNDWLKRRIEIFKNYTLQALLNQTNMNYVLWISFRPEEKNNPMVKDLEKKLTQRLRGITPIFTYNGLCFWDDKLPHEKAFYNLFKNLYFSLPLLKQHITEDYVMMVIQPSDDMYLSSVVEDLHKTNPQEGKAVGYKNGYVMNYHTKEICEYNPDTNPPFYGIIFPKDKFLDPWDHMKYTGLYKSHEEIPEIFDFEELPRRGYVVGTHGSNISTAWDIPYKGKKLLAEEQELVIIQTGIKDSPCIKPISKFKNYLNKIICLTTIKVKRKNSIKNL